MPQQIIAPRVFHGRLKGEHQHTLRPHAFGKLVGSEGLAEAHLGVPQVVAGAIGLLFVHPGEVVGGLSHRLRLLIAHLVVEVAHRLDVRIAMAHSHVCRLRLAQGAAAPLANEFLAHTAQVVVEVVVAEALAAAIGVEGVVVPQQMVSLVRFGDGMLLVDALIHIDAARLPDFDPAWEGNVVVHVDLRDSTSAVGEDLVYCLHNQNLSLLFHRPYHALDKDNLVLVQTVFLVQHLVGPGVGEVLEGNELIYRFQQVLCRLSDEYHKSEEL